jgi:single-strand DNA-binding protein
MRVRRTWGRAWRATLIGISEKGRAMTEILTITGNVATEPEQRVLPGGATVTSFRVAAAHRRFDKNAGRWVDKYTNWYTVSAFRALGEHAHASLHQGDRVIVVGRMHLRAWDNGTKAGTSADIEAEALGHDLLFGTTVYTAGAPVAAPSEGAAAAAPAETGSRDADGWSIPAGGELVSAAAGGDDAETPF